MRDPADARKTVTSWLAEVIIMPKEGVNDPEGEAILGGLHSLGHGTVNQVRAGRVMRLSLTASDSEDAYASVKQMCDQLLANPVIESYDIAVAAGISSAEANE